MRMETFEQERMQCTWENFVDVDLSESGVYPVKMKELQEMGLDLENFMETPLKYIQSNGTPELRELIAQYYPGANVDMIEVMNGTSEANFIVSHVLVNEGDKVGIQYPNYLADASLVESIYSTGEVFVPLSLLVDGEARVLEIFAGWRTGLGASTLVIGSYRSPSV